MQLNIFEQEIWRSINDYKGLYEVNNEGKIKSISKYVLRGGKGKKVWVEEKILKLNFNKGYLSIYLCKNGIRKKYKVHALVANAFIPNIQRKPQINHINGIKDDNRIGNLEWVTNYENMRHGYDNGLINNKGTYNGRAKINQQIANQIRKEREEGATFLQLSNKHKIGHTTVGHIIHRRTWNYNLSKAN